ncbi:MAG: class I SAM-dependent methyltransferase [Oscillospiraceae bacterium]|nr:class I SAM-dependent methyltransferase [Oscillospiraceae bacterium]
MIWDTVSPVYDLFENVYNRKVYQNTGRYVAEEIGPDDLVLECACGTGAISRYIAPECKMLIATDLSDGMRKQTAKACRSFHNVKVRYADLMHLKCADERFDKVVAGNVLHLLDEPELALKELLRVCKKGGRVIIPTYINDEGTSQRKAVMLLEKLGVRFKREFDLRSYAEFFKNAGYPDVRIRVVRGKMPCAIAIITKE